MMAPQIISCLAQVTIVLLAAMVLCLIASRRRPAERAAILTTATLAIVAVTGLLVCPLPAWWNLLPVVAADRSSLEVNDRDKSAQRGATAPRADFGSSENHSGSQLLLDSRMLDWLRNTVTQINVEPASTSRPWLVGLLGVFALGASGFLLRIGFGLHWVRRLRLRSRPLTEARVERVLARVEKLAPSPRMIQLFESDHIVAAATIGWLRPVIILPADWRNWSADELLAALAHEVAHVRRGDYPLRLLAYLVAAVHFYHPLAHWLTRSLVRQQELAADQLAATLAGGRRRYLHALSLMALRQDDRSSVWSGSIALPVSSVFLMRRIEMLRAKECSTSKCKTSQSLLVATLVLLSLGATAVRCVAQKPKEAPAPRVARRDVDGAGERIGLAEKGLFQRKPFDPALLAGEGSSLMVIRPAAFFGREEMHVVRDLYNREFLMDWQAMVGDEKLDFRVELIELIAGDLQIVVENNPEPGQSRLMFGAGKAMIRMTEPFDWKSFIFKLLPETQEKKYQGQPYLELPVIPALGPAKLNVCILDDRTLFFLGSGTNSDDGTFNIEDVQRTLVGLAQPAPRYAWADEWAAMDGGLFTIALDLQDTKWLEVRGVDNDWKSLVAPLIEGSQYLCLGGDWSDTDQRFVMRSRAVYQQRRQAEQVKQALENLMTFFGESMKKKPPEKESDLLLHQRLLSFLENFTFEVANRSDDSAVVAGRGQVEIPFEQIRQLTQPEDQ